MNLSAVWFYTQYALSFKNTANNTYFFIHSSLFLSTLQLLFWDHVTFTQLYLLYCPISQFLYSDQYSLIKSNPTEPDLIESDLYFDHGININNLIITDFHSPCST